ncbi:uncharacterized protein LY89DRAFT_781698 [Mollisia scopiformis]|uniref:DUF7923 domain-containing protein n=1 Tax=Mollisia scopiformis TaxID=149040 RepID=A0A194XBF7_MOLSC|nr:uncharacterized protein LY89DRAFT_781698 [Mollisia scopiformis]KUJ17501.1 hypothetical protein LY89DRAFT_781698 [Mollisia scopiformis]
MECAVEGEDYRSRLKEFQDVEARRLQFIEEMLSKLDTVTADLERVTQDRAREVSILKADLETEREARRGLQEKNGNLLLSVSKMEQARFVLVLVDADADIYLFRDGLLAQGGQGGQFAAEELIAKVREYLATFESFKDAAKIPIMVKAYANFSGLAQACMRDKKVVSMEAMMEFWCGFTRRFPLVDFINVGPGKEEADSKLREVLAHHIVSPLCEHVLLACCHDAGYVPVLRQYAAQKDFSSRITLIASGPFRGDMVSLGLRTTKSFEPLFGHVKSSQSVRSYAEVGAVAPRPPSTSKAVLSVQDLKLSGKPVANCDRLRPILFNEAGKRIDKPLSVHGDCVKEIRKRNLCSWHYLRADCIVDGCKKVHDFRRPLTPKNYDALWCISRENVCRRLSKHGKCEDDQCIFGHGFV